MLLLQLPQPGQAGPQGGRRLDPRRTQQRRPASGRCREAAACFWGAVGQAQQLAAAPHLHCCLPWLGLSHFGPQRSAVAAQLQAQQLSVCQARERLEAGCRTSVSRWRCRAHSCMEGTGRKGDARWAGSGCGTSGGGSGGGGPSSDLSAFCYGVRHVGRLWVAGQQCGLRRSPRRPAGLRLSQHGALAEPLTVPQVWKPGNKRDGPSPCRTALR